MPATASRWIATLALGLAGGATGVAVAGGWLWRFEQSLGTSCDLGCVVFLPLFPALAIAGAFAGIVTARRGWRATAPGWALLGALAASALVFPEALAWLLMAPFDLAQGSTDALVLLALVLWTAVPAGGFWVACKSSRGRRQPPDRGGPARGADPRMQS